MMRNEPSALDLTDIDSVGERALRHGMLARKDAQTVGGRVYYIKVGCRVFTQKFTRQPLFIGTRLFVCAFV